MAGGVAKIPIDGMGIGVRAAKVVLELSNGLGVSLSGWFCGGPYEPDVDGFGIPDRDSDTSLPLRRKALLLTAAVSMLAGITAGLSAPGMGDMPYGRRSRPTAGG